MLEVEGGVGESEVEVDGEGRRAGGGEGEGRVAGHQNQRRLRRPIPHSSLLVFCTARASKTRPNGKGRARVLAWVKSETGIRIFFTVALGYPRNL